MSAKLIKLKFENTKISFTKNGLFFILLCSLALIHQAGILNMYYLTAIFVSIIMFGWAMLQYIRNGKNGHTRFAIQIKNMGKLFLFPWIILIAYNILIFALGIAYSPFMKSSFVQIMFAPCIILGALGSYYLFKEKTLRYFLYAVVLQYIVVTVYKLFDMGASEFFRGIASIITGSGDINPMEANSDLVLALGLLLIFYSDNLIKFSSDEKRHVAFIGIMVLLGGKRIEFLAILVIILASIFSKALSERKRKIIQNIIGVFVCIALFLFVYLVISGLLSTYVYSHGINTMGRMKMWDYVAQYVKFSPDYFGKGYSFSNLILEQNSVLTYGGKTYVLHSDVLKIFFDMGFWMFSFWLYFSLFVFPKKVRKLFGFKVGNLVWFLIIYLFVLYTTDNCINYYASQTLFVFVVLRSIEVRNNYNAVQ